MSALLLALVLACARGPVPEAAEAIEPSPALAELPTPAPQPAPEQPPAAQCEADDGCGLVRAFAGLDHIPDDPTAALCGTLCYVAIPADQVAAWEAQREAQEHLVPCDKKLARCSSMEERRAACIQGRCEVMPR